MKIEIITIGDELLSGHTVDTNAAFIARKLMENGMEATFMSSTGDSVEMMIDVFRLALSRADCVITTGGLGPTDDDITKKAIVKVFKRNLIYHEEILDDIKKRFESRGLEMPALNQNQALIPQGATIFKNPIGSAVGIGMIENNKIMISLPGVPKEAESIFQDEIIPFLLGKFQKQISKIIKLRTTGITESKLAEIIMPDLKIPSKTKLAYLPGYGGVDLRIISKSDNLEESTNNALELKRYLENKVGKYIYGLDDDNLESVIGQLLLDNDKTISVAESCTGGMLGSMITSIPGSSKYFMGGVISYSNEIKINELKVPSDIIEKFGAVSEECAVAMADGCRKKYETDYALSITGIAGPEGGTETKAVGTTYIGLASIHDKYARRFNLGTDRNINRKRASYSALELLRREMLDIK